jgi:glycosyltransferase involved in cell wall biosynthesis
LPLPGYEGLQFGLPAGRLLNAQWTMHRPDIVYIATEGPLGWSAMRVAERLGIAALSGFHTNYHFYSRHYRLRYLHWLVFRYLRYFHNSTRGTMVPSPDLRLGLQEKGFKNVAFIGRGVDSCLFAPEQRSTELRRNWGLADHELGVLYVGRIAAEKNLQLAVDAYYKMQRIDGAIKFILVGDGPLRAGLQKQYPMLIFSGMKTGEALARHYASGDIFLFPSETETFGNVTLEAMASGLAVVAYNCAAAKLHIAHNDNGLLAPCGDSTAFIDSAARLVRDRRLLYKLRRKARETAGALDWAHVIGSFESWLDTAMANRTGNVPARHRDVLWSSRIWRSGDNGDGRSAQPI